MINTVEVHSASFIVENLCQVKDLAWAKYAFSREPLTGKFNDLQKVELTQKALNCGMEIAREYIKTYGTSSPTKLAANLGLTVAYPKIPQNGGRVLFAEFRPPKQINIFTDAIDKAAKLMEDPSVANTLGNINIPEILLSHEIFHFIEETKASTIWTKTFKLDLWGIGPLRNKSRVVCLSEIAAMGFCKEINNLKFSPYVMDAFLVYEYSAENATRLFNEMMAYAREEDLL